MNTTSEQQEVVSNTVETFTRMSEVTFSGIERLTALNVNMARESVQQGIEASMSIARSQNGKDQDCEDQDGVDQADDQDKVQNRLIGAGVQRVTAYVRGVHEIFMEAQSEFAELIGNHMRSFGMNGPMSFPGMQVFEKIAQQTGEMAKANVRNVAEMTKANVRNVAEASDEVAEVTEKVVEKASQGRKSA